jgi:hypothetical protein
MSQLVYGIIDIKARLAKKWDRQPIESAQTDAPQLFLILLQSLSCTRGCQFNLRKIYNNLLFDFLYFINGKLQGKNRYRIKIFFLKISQINYGDSAMTTVINLTEILESCLASHYKNARTRNRFTCSSSSHRHSPSDRYRTLTLSPVD